jgi:SAM-dependent methyltransferase
VKDSKKREKERLNPKAIGEMREWLTTMPLSVQSPEKSLRYIADFVAVAANLRLPQNSRILELGAGSCWPSEWLYRMGYRTVSSDIAIDMLRLGRERFQHLRRERDNYALDAHFVCGDAEELPFADGVFDAVVIFNAFHHFPDLSAALVEIGRVLNETGRFIFAEPGEGHSMSDEAQREMDEHGVLERDILIEEVARLSKEAGFTSAGVILNRFPDALVPCEDWGRFAVPYRGLRGKSRFMSDLVERQKKHPCLVLSKGEEEALDSRRPGLLKAALKVVDLPASVQAGHPFLIRVEAANRGDTRWISQGTFLSTGAMNRGEGGYVNLGVKLKSADGTLLDDNYGRGRFREDVPPGGRVEISALLKAPGESGRFQLKLDLVDEGVAWFEDCGSATVSADLRVIPAEREPLFESPFPDLLEAGITLETLALPERAGGELRAAVTVRNRGNTLWLMKTPEGDPPAFGGGYVRCGLQLRDGKGRLLDLNYGRLSLPADVAPGDEAILPVTVQVPEKPGSYRLVFDMVNERICWFAEVGSSPVSLEFTVPEAGGD